MTLSGCFFIFYEIYPFAEYHCVAISLSQKTELAVRRISLHPKKNDTLLGVAFLVREMGFWGVGEYGQKKTPLGGVGGNKRVSYLSEFLSLLYSKTVSKF